MKQEPKKYWYNFLSRSFRQRVAPDTISIIPDPAAIPLGWEQKEAIKTLYTSGREYFLFTGDIDPRRHQLLILLKAFSQFKKWQRSDMKLVIAGNTTKRTGELKEQLATYKYKQDVLLIQDPEQSVLLQIIASAYALIYLDNKDVSSAGILNALQSHIPVIAGKTASIEKMMGERGLFVVPGNHEDLAAKLLLLYKDEGFRKTIIGKP